MPAFIRRQLVSYLRRPVRISWLPSRSTVLFVEIARWL